jgi:hypothetical protein
LRDFEEFARIIDANPYDANQRHSKWLYILGKPWVGALAGLQTSGTKRLCEIALLSSPVVETLNQRLRAFPTCAQLNVYGRGSSRFID